MGYYKAKKRKKYKKRSQFVRGIRKDEFKNSTIADHPLIDRKPFYISIKIRNIDIQCLTYEATDELGGGSKGTYKWIGGTGKFEGIGGGGEFTNISLPASAEGIFQGYSKLKNQWKIP